MKTFRYFAAFMAAAFMFNACEEANVLNTQNKDKEKPSVTLTQKVADDVTLTFEITASENASQYAYAVFAGSDNAVPAAYDIVVEETLADASGSFNVALNEGDSNKNTVTVDCQDFPAKTYQVFAAAITETGLLGEVVSLDVTMNDTWIPQPAGATPDGNTVTLSFDEPVKRGKGKAYVSAIAWGVGEYYLEDQEITEENITIDVNTVTIVCPELGNGAGYMVSFEAGFVTDLSGNPCAECKSGWDNDASKYVNIGWDTENVPVAITESMFKEPAEDVNWAAEDANIVFTLPTEMMVNTKVQNAISVLYDESEGQSILYADWVLGEDYKTVTVYLPKMPTGKFDVFVEAGAFFDIWDNITLEFEPTDLRYSNYLVEVVEGAYMVDYLYPDAEGNAALGQFPIEVVSLDDGSFMLLADWFNYVSNEMGMEGYVCKPYLYGTIDYTNMQLVFDGTQIDISTGQLGSNAFANMFYYYDENKEYALAFWGGGSGKEPITLSINEEGYLISMSYCDYSIHNASSGKYTGLYGCTATTDDADARVTYVPKETETQTSNAPVFNYVEIETVQTNTVFTK